MSLFDFLKKESKTTSAQDAAGRLEFIIAQRRNGVDISPAFYKDFVELLQRYGYVDAHFSPAELIVKRETVNGMDLIGLNIPLNQPSVR